MQSLFLDSWIDSLSKKTIEHSDSQRSLTSLCWARNQRTHIHRIISSNSIKKYLRVFYRCTKYTHLVQGMSHGLNSVSRNSSIRRFESHNSTECGGQSNRSTSICPKSTETLSMSNRSGRARATTTRYPCMISWIFSRTKCTVFTTSSHSKLIHCIFSYHQTASFFQFQKTGSTILRYIIFQYLGTTSRYLTLRHHNIFDTNWRCTQWFCQKVVKMISHIFWCVWNPRVKLIASCFLLVLRKSLLGVKRAISDSAYIWW